MAFSPHRQTVEQFMSDVDAALADVRESIRLQACELDRQADPDDWRPMATNKRDVLEEADRLRNLYRFVALGESYDKLASRPELSFEEKMRRRRTVISQIKRAANYLGIDISKRPRRR